MLKRTVFTLVAAAVIAVPATVAPVLFTPAAAQASFNVNLSVPAAMPVPYVGVVRTAGPFYAWGEGWRHWEGEHRGWDRDHRWREERRDWDRRRDWDHHH